MLETMAILSTVFSVWALTVAYRVIREDVNKAKFDRYFKGV